MSRFNFTLVTKPRRGGLRTRRNLPTNPDAVRITADTIMIGKGLLRRFLGRKKSVTVQIEKDPMSDALRLTTVPKNSVSSDTAYIFHPTPGKRNLHTHRPAALYDMANGNYVEDLKEEGVFVLEA